jgi:hypothetical protein
LPAPSVEDKTIDPSYKEWFKFRLTVRDRQGQILHIVDQFEDVEYNEGLNLFRLTCSTGSAQTGLFDLAFYDNENSIDMTKVGLGNIVEIEGGKRQDTMRHIFYGFCREVEPTRPGGDVLRWRMSGFGSGIILREILMNVTRKARLFDIENLGTDKHDSATQANVLIEDILSKPEFMIEGTEALKEIIGCTLNGISAQAIDTVPFLDALNGTSDAIINRVCETVGMVCGLDSENDFYLRYPTSVHSGINMKVLQIGEAYNANDYAIDTAYVIGPYAAPISIKQEDGFANFVRSTALNNRDFVGGSSEDKGFKTLAFQALAQRFIPGSLGFNGLALLLSKVGTVTSQKNRINGAIFKDTGIATNIRPSSIKVATFHISLDAIPLETPRAIEDIDMNIINKNFDASAPHWLMLYMREGDEENTVRWHHNGDFLSPDQYSAIAIGTSRDTTDPPWQIFPSGPTFAYASFQTLRHEVVASDPFSVDRYGPIMMDVANDFIDDTYTMNKYLNTQLSIASIPQIRYTPMQVRIPNECWFQENTQITFLDPKIGASNLVQRQAGIQQVFYGWDAYSTGRPGIKTCELTILGYYDWLTESEPLAICQGI